MAGGKRLDSNFIHLGLGATAVAQPDFTGLEWYESYGERHGIDGREGRLVAMYSFTESWDVWEMHPVGDEVVICTEGKMKLIQEFPDGRVESLMLLAGEYAINPAGVWHTADISEQASAVFITAGEGTQHRAR